MNYYPEQMDAISDLCKVLNEWGKRHTDDVYFTIPEIVLTSIDGVENDEPFGKLTDEIGDAWSFTPAGADL